MFWRRWREKREEQILECLHPLEWRGISEVCEKFKENNPNSKPIPSEKAIKDLIRLMGSNEVEMSLRLKRFVKMDAHGVSRDFAVFEIIWKLSGKISRKKVKKKKKRFFGNLVPQGT
jgi:hypothetical protein